MDIETVAASAIIIVTPYLKEAANGFVQKAGEMLAEKAGSLYQTIKTKFAGDSSAETKLMLVEKEPESKALMSVFEEELVKKMQADQNFAKTINHLVEEAKGADSNKVLVFGDRSVGIGGDMSGGTIVTGDSNTFGKS